MEVTIYGGIDGIDIPDYDADLEECEDYINQLVYYAKQKGKGKYKGRTLKFQVADGYATYVILNTEDSIKLIHDGTMDGYHEPMVEHINIGQIEQNLETQKALKELFG